MTMQKAVRNKGRKTHILQKKSLHLRKEKAWGNFAGQGAQPTEDRATRVSKEIDRYLQAPQQGSTEDPLEWWKANAISYPALSRLSKKYLCISATSSASECLFSTAGNVVTKKRSLLKPEKVDMLVFLAKNL